MAAPAPEGESFELGPTQIALKIAYSGAIPVAFVNSGAIPSATSEAEPSEAVLSPVRGLFWGVAGGV